MRNLREQDLPHVFCHQDPVQVAGAPTGPCSGLQCGSKDIEAIKGCRTGFGDPQWLALQRAALLDAGAGVLGKTQTDEFTSRLTGENHHDGTPVTLNVAGRIPGGRGAEVWAAQGAQLTPVQSTLTPGGRPRWQWAAQLEEVDIAPPRTPRLAIAARLDDLRGTDGVLIIPSAPGSAPGGARRPPNLTSFG